MKVEESKFHTSWDQGLPVAGGKLRDLQALREPGGSCRNCANS
jgi:hypothetical protein